MDQKMAPEQLDLPGFRFHPTEEELLDFYLKNMVFGKKLRCDIIGYLNIYDYDPRALPGLSKIGEREWYFFVPRDRKHGTGGRPNRTTANGFWKATGSDRRIVSLSEPKRVLGLRKTLVFYNGRAPRGTKTDWVMNEYRFPDTCTLPKDVVLCKIYRKATSMKVLEQRAAMEEEMKAACHGHPQKRHRSMVVVHDDQSPSSSSSSPLSSSLDTMISFGGHHQEDAAPTVPDHHHQLVVVPPPMIQLQGGPVVPEHFKEEAVEEMMVQAERPNGENASNNGSSSSSSAVQFPGGRNNNKLPELQVPSYKVDLDWNSTDASFWLSSPWIPSFTTPNCGSMLNFYA